MGEVLEWVCDLGGEINKGILFIIWKNHFLAACALTIGRATLKILFMTLLKYKKVFKAYCLQEDGLTIFLK